MYPKALYAGWGDMDFNSHMAGTAYLNKCGDVRMMLFAENGFSMSELARHRSRAPADPQLPSKLRGVRPGRCDLDLTSLCAQLVR